MLSSALLRLALLALVQLAKAQCTDLTVECCAATEAQLNAKYEAHLAEHNVDAGGEFDMQTRHRCVILHQPDYMYKQLATLHTSLSKPSMKAYIWNYPLLSSSAQHSQCLRDKAALHERCADIEYQKDYESCTAQPLSEARWQAALSNSSSSSISSSTSTNDISESEIAACRAQRFLLHTRNSGDYFAGHSHKT
jgi:hypothetical protein